MGININGKIIATDEEGYLLNHNDWNFEVQEALLKQHKSEGNKFSTDKMQDLIVYFRDYYLKYKIQPSLYKMALTLEKVQEYKSCQLCSDMNYLYRLFPHGPIRMLFKLSGLQNPITPFSPVK